MSIILDALRIGSGKPAPGAKSTPAQTDAILHTLGYGRNTSSPIDRLKRVVVYLGVALAFAGMLAVAAIWLARLYVASDVVPLAHGKVIFFPDGSIKRP